VLKVEATEVEVGALQVKEMQALRAVTIVQEVVRVAQALQEVVKVAQALQEVVKVAQALQGATGAGVEVLLKVKADLRKEAGQAVQPAPGPAVQTVVDPPQEKEERDQRRGQTPPLTLAVTCPGRRASGPSAVTMIVAALAEGMRVAKREGMISIRLRWMHLIRKLKWILVT